MKEYIKTKFTLHKGARLFEEKQTQTENDKLNDDMKYTANERRRKKKTMTEKVNDLVFNQQQIEEKEE